MQVTVVRRAGEFSRQKLEEYQGGPAPLGERYAEIEEFGFRDEYASIITDRIIGAMKRGEYVASVRQVDSGIAWAALEFVYVKPSKPGLGDYTDILFGC
jgi:hypothetical protein